jgi:hypothetical protein
MGWQQSDKHTYLRGSEPRKRDDEAKYVREISICARLVHRAWTKEMTACGESAAWYAAITTAPCVDEGYSERRNKLAAADVIVSGTHHETKPRFPESRPSTPDLQHCRPLQHPLQPSLCQSQFSDRQRSTKARRPAASERSRLSTSHRCKHPRGCANQGPEVDRPDEAEGALSRPTSN